MITKLACKSSAILMALLLSIVPASATVFIFHQTSASLPNLFIDSAITINGSSSDLPTVNSNSNPIDFGNLLTFDFLSPLPFQFGHITLSDFTPACPLGSLTCREPGFPDWHISPLGIDWIDSLDSEQFTIHGFGAGSIISVNSDLVGSLCGHTGACVAIGDWVAIGAIEVPEPPANWIFLSAVVLLFLTSSLRIRRRTS